jgi:hypothetical protein
MGTTLTGVGLFVWTLIGHPPPWAIATALLGGFIFASYFTWRDEYLRLQTALRRPESLRAYVKGTIGSVFSSSQKLTFRWIYADLDVAVLNAGSPTIIEGWALEFDGQSVAMRPRSLEESLTADERTKIENLLALSHRPLATGGRKELLLKFVLKDLTEKDDDDEWRESTYHTSIDADPRTPHWFLTFRDVSGVAYKVPLAKRGLFLSNIESTDLTPITETV